MDASTTLAFLESGAGTIAGLAIQIIAILVVFIILFLYGFYSGRDGLVSIIFSLYVAIPLHSAFPYANLFLSAESPERTMVIANAAFFLGIAIFVFILLRRFIHIETPVYGTWRIAQTALLSALGTVVAVGIGYHILSVQSAYDFAGPIEQFLTLPNALFWWLAIPLIGMLFILRR